MNGFEIKDKVKKLLQDGKKLEAVKFARDFLKIGLVEAKELVEAAESELIASGHYNPLAMPAVVSFSCIVKSGGVSFAAIRFQIF